MIPYGKQSINQSDIDAVVSVLKSDFLTQGKKVVEFENSLARYCGASYAKAVSSGTAALHLAYMAIGLGPKDIVWTVPNTFVATVNAALYCGAEVEFVDIDSETYNISIEKLKDKLTRAKEQNCLPKLIVPVHFSGQSCEMKDIWELSKEYGFRVIEDASHALGGEYMGKKVGSCEYSDLAVFSFHPVKMITTGEGGAVITNSKRLNNRVELLRSHGIIKDKDRFKIKSEGDWYYEQQALGFNYRITDIQSALGISQLQRLDEFVAKRREVAKFYLGSLKNVILPYQHPAATSSWHLFVIQVKNRRAVYEKLRTQGILTQVHYIPVTQQPFHSSQFLQNSYNFYQHCLSLPIYVDLTIEEQLEVVKSLQ